jgi:hypothetical protein
MRDDPVTGDLMTPSEMEAELKLSASTLAQWRWLKKGPPWVKVGRHVRYSRRGYEKWLASGADSPAGQAAS